MNYAEEDYKVKIDKLGCPVCKKEQSFTEFYEKKRSCGNCKQKFTTLKVANMSKYQKDLKENELKRFEKLKKIDADVYGTLGKLPEKVNISLTMSLIYG